MRRRLLVLSGAGSVLAALAGLLACTDAPPTAPYGSRTQVLSASQLAAAMAAPAGASVRDGVKGPRPSFLVTTTTDAEGSTTNGFDFEELANGSPVWDSFASYGTHYDNATAYSVYNAGVFPPHSGYSVITATIPGSGVVTVTFDSSVSAFGAYGTSIDPLQLACFDSAGATVGTYDLPTPNANDGHSVYSPNLPMDVVGAGITRCTFSGTNNGYSLDDFHFQRGPTAPKLSVKCSPPSPILRGENVDCTTSIRPQVPYTIIARRAEAEGQVFVDSTPVSVTDRGNFEDDWIGEAIVPTRVTITAKVTLHGKTTTVTSAPDSFTVRARTVADGWPRLTLSPTAPTPQIDPGSALKTYPPFQKDTSGFYVGASGGLGTTPINVGYSIVRVKQGPNTNWLYERIPATLDTVNIFYSRVMDPGSTFYQQQDGTDVIDGKKRYHGCGSSDMNSLLTQVLTHERGHYAAAVKYFTTHDVQGAFEAGHHYLAASTTPGDTVEKAAIKDLVRTAYQAGFDATQDPLDQKGTPYPISVSCVFHGPFPQR